MKKHQRNAAFDTLFLLLILSLLFTCTTAFAQTKPKVKINPKTYIPKNAYIYMDLVQEETAKFFPTIPIPHYFPALIEQESCLSLTHSRCWRPDSQLLSAREQGAGFGQLTRAYRKDGSLRFDSLKAMRDKNMAELKELSWDNILKRPDLQTRTMVLMIKDEYKALYKITDPIKRLHMADVAYNGGRSDLNKERLLCGLTKGCDSQTWFDHVERMKVKSTIPIYGTRSAWDINREHPETLFHIRLNKYEQFYK